MCFFLLIIITELEAVSQILARLHKHCGISYFAFVVLCYVCDLCLR